jgi:hypothetical protein
VDPDCYQAIDRSDFNMTGIQNEDNFGLREHWKVLLAMSLVSISTFQYGLDFGIIGGLQAMKGFLQVREP